MTDAVQIPAAGGRFGPMLGHGCAANKAAMISTCLSVVHCRGLHHRAAADAERVFHHSPKLHPRAAKPRPLSQRPT